MQAVPTFPPVVKVSSGGYQPKHRSDLIRDKLLQGSCWENNGGIVRFKTFVIWLLFWQ